MLVSALFLEHDKGDGKGDRGDGGDYRMGRGGGIGGMGVTVGLSEGMGRRGRKEGEGER